MGGGEPTLSWDLVTQTVRYAQGLFQEGDKPIRWGISTNGSILTDEMIVFFREYSFDVQFSFDVLPDVQNSQRGCFDKVSENLVRYSEAGIRVRIRSTITRLNVSRMEEMVRFCQQHYPLVKSLACEAVVDPALLTSSQEADDFFSAYFDSFVRAREIARQTGLDCVSSGSKSLFLIRNRFCGGIYCLTPFGTLSPCPFVSSPREKDYNALVFGKIEHGRVEMDDERYKRLIGSFEGAEECRSCFARWNCGGGCPNQRRTYSRSIFSSICRHMRDMVKHMLLAKLEERYTATNRVDFRESIHNIFINKD